MLKNKIDREMEKFAVVEEAFKSIKIATVQIFIVRELIMLKI